MKKILLAMILLMLSATNAQASEIFGQISTNPNATPNGQNNPPEAEEPVNPPPIINNPPGGAVIILPQLNRLSGQSVNNQTGIQNKEVLGVKLYTDGTLLRGSDKKIYIIKGQEKKYITSLNELAKYRGRSIIKATDQELSAYQTRPHLNGELVRQTGEVKVYLVKSGGKQHILNLEELRAKFFGQEIFNISREEMALY
jgi:hypothetical protein